MKSNFILASASPRRLELLRQIGIEPVVIPADIEEISDPTLSPEKIVMSNAYRKAEAAATQAAIDDIILGADTIVIANGQIFGKPRHDLEAHAMLNRLSGKKHSVYSGICLIKGEQIQIDYRCTDVFFTPLSQAEIENYVASGESADKAGAYGIQGIGGTFIERIEGDYYTVVGLPLVLLKEMLKKINVLT